VARYQSFRSTAEHAEHAETETYSQVVVVFGWCKPRTVGATPTAAAGEMITPPNLGVLGVLGV
jgi:hypothetical protein